MFVGAYTWRGLFSEFYGIAVYGYDPALYWVLSVSLKLAPVRLFSCRTISLQNSIVYYVQIRMIYKHIYLYYLKEYTKEKTNLHCNTIPSCR